MVFIGVRVGVFLGAASCMCVWVCFLLHVWMCFLRLRVCGTHCGCLRCCCCSCCCCSCQIHCWCLCSSHLFCCCVVDVVVCGFIAICPLHNAWYLRFTFSKTLFLLLLLSRCDHPQKGFLSTNVSGSAYWLALSFAGTELQEECASCATPPWC